MALEKAKDHKKVRFEFQHHRADGSIRDVEVFSSNIKIHGKGILHSIIHDITERKQAERAMAQALKVWQWRPGDPIDLTGDSISGLAQIKDLLHLERTTVNGCTLGENLARAPVHEMARGAGPGAGAALLADADLLPPGHAEYVLIELLMKG